MIYIALQGCDSKLIREVLGTKISAPNADKCCYSTAMVMREIRPLMRKKSWIENCLKHSAPFVFHPGAAIMKAKKQATGRPVNDKEMKLDRKLLESGFTIWIPSGRCCYESAEAGKGCGRSGTIFDLRALGLRQL